MEKSKSLKDQLVQNTGLEASALRIFHYHVVFSTVIQKSANCFCLDHNPRLQVTCFINHEPFRRQVQTNYLDKAAFLALTRKDAFNTRKEKLGGKVQRPPAPAEASPVPSPGRSRSGGASPAGSCGTSSWSSPR